MFTTNRKWRCGARAADTYGWMVFGLFFTIWGIGFLITAINHRDLVELVASSLFTLVGVAQMIGARWLLSRNYIEFDDTARKVVVATSGDTITMPFGEAQFIVPARRSFLPAYVQLEPPTGSRIRCGLVTQGRIWNSHGLRAFTNALTQREISHQAEP